MKKALVVFLILAVAGGLFAQLTISGNVQTGLGIGLSDAEGDAGKPVVNYIRNRGDSGIQFQLNAGYKGEKEGFGTYGATGQFRVQQGRWDGTWDATRYQIGDVNLYWQPSSLLFIHLGNGGGGGFGTMGGIDDGRGVVDADGLKIKLTGVAPGLNIGASAIYGKAQRNFEDMNYAFGVTYGVPSLLNVAANIHLYPEVKDYTKLQFGAGVSYIGLASVGLNRIAADFGAYDFGNAEKNYIGIGERVDFAVGALSLVVRSQQFLALGTDLNKDFMPMLFRGELSYKINDIVTAAVQGVYLLGNKPDVNWRNATEGTSVNSVDSFARDTTKGLTISPVLTFSVGPTINVGWNFRTDLTEGAATPKTYNLFYATVDIGF